MNIQIMCSNCGHRSRKYRIDRFSFISPAEEYVKAGWDSFGDALYCRKCCETWEERNGKDRPLWGREHTKDKIHEIIIDHLQRVIEYQQTGVWDV